MSPAGRPRLPIGSHGNIKVTEIAPGVWKARCRFRDADGHTRPVQRQGKSRQDARNNIQDALRNRPSFADSEITSETPLSVVAESWFESLERAVAQDLLSPATVATYRSNWRTHMLGAIGELLCREATTPCLNRFM